MFKSLIRKILFRIRAEYTTDTLIKKGLIVGANFKRLHGVILDPSHCWLIKIGDNVTMAPRVHILAHDASTKNTLNYTIIGKVIIGNNVFIGANTVVLPNINIGDHVIIGANSTVSKSLPSNGVYAGNPTKFICSYDDYINKHKTLMKKSIKFNGSYKDGIIDKSKKAEMIKSVEGLAYLK